jgi:GxxExxY protein
LAVGLGIRLHRRSVMTNSPEIEQVTWNVIKCAMKVHSALGPGLLESVYLACLAFDLRDAGFKADVKVKLPLTYRGIQLDAGYEIDIIVNDLVVIELKTVTAILPVHHAQLITYLKLTGKPIGLLLNFNVAHLKDGIVRKINTPKETNAAIAGLS